MKTVNFLTSHFIPENTACTNRVVSFVEELAKQYKVNVICLTEKGVYQEEVHVNYQRNIDIYYINQKKFDGKNFFQRAFYEVYYLLKLVRFSKSVPCDITIATAPYMFMIPIVGLGLKRLKILDIRDLVWEYLDEQGIIKRVIKKVLKLLMIYGIRKFNYVLVTNEYEFNILNNNEYKVSNIGIVPNGIDKKRFDQLSSLSIEPNRSFTVTYVGNIGLAQNLSVFIDAAKKLPDVKFVMIGDGIELKTIKDKVSNYKLDNVVITGKLEWHELEEYYKKSSVLYAQLDEKYISAMPSKLFEYASIGLPIIYGGIGQAPLFVEKLEHTIVIRPNDAEALIEAIGTFKTSKFKTSEKNKKLIKDNYLRKSSAEKLVSIVDGCLQDKKGG